MILIALVAFICGGLTGKNGKHAGLIAGLVISSILSMPFVLPGVSSENLGAGFLAVTIILIIIAPVIGLVAGPAGEEVSQIRENGFAGIPRLHFFWLWLPGYHYGLILIQPLANFIKLNYTMSSQNPFLFLWVILPLILYGAPLFIGMCVLAGTLMSGVWSWARQIIGSVIIIGGIVVIYTFQYWLSDS